MPSNQIENKSDVKFFPYQVGDQFKRSEMHELVGGSFRHGMTSCSEGNEFLLFHDSKKNKKFGYDLWEGPQIDGSFHYTGQGTTGDQKMTKSNLALIKANDSGKKIHLIESKDGVCTYAGEFMLGEPRFEILQAPDINKQKNRDVFVFKLIPVGKNLILKSFPEINKIESESRKWNAPSSSQVRISKKIASETVSDRKEHKLQAEFGNYMIGLGHVVENYEFMVSGVKGRLKPDFWISNLNLVVEAKASASRDYVRLGIGQILDYVNLAKIQGVHMKPALLLPDQPSSDLIELVKNLGITLIFKDLENFVFIEPN